MESDGRHAQVVHPRNDAGFHDAPARISVRGARAAFVGPGLNLSPHRNAVSVVAITLGEPFDLALLETRDTTEADYQTREAALIAPGQLHHLRVRGPMSFIYLDALSDDHAALESTDLIRRSSAVREAVRRGGSVDELCNCLGLPHKPAPDPRIAALLQQIDLRPDDFERLAVAARLVGVSPSRCRELFRHTAGVPFRRYRLWRRFASVMRELSRGRSLTEAAYSAGFASSAHLSSAFKAMFGLAPSALVKLGASFDLEPLAPIAR